MEKIYGNLQGIKSSQIEQLQKLYEQRQPGDLLMTCEFAQQLAAISHEIHQPLCSYINRRGQVVRVGVGTPVQTQFSPSDLPRQSAERLSGIRCLAVQSQAPDTASFVAMVRQRLDALVVLSLDGNGSAHPKNAVGQIKAAYLAHIVPDLKQPWTVSSELSLDELTQEDFDDLVHEWETGLRAARFNLTQVQSVASDRDRVLLVGLMTNDITQQQFQDRLAELARLVESAGGEVVGTIQQKRSQPHPQTVVGLGLVEEIAVQARRLLQLIGVAHASPQ